MLVKEEIMDKESEKRVLTAYSGYNELQDIFQLALRRAAIGKGKIRHAEEGQLFENQQICDDLRGTDKSAAIFQIRKKAREVLRLSRRQDKVNELLDVCVYAAAAVLVLIEEQQELDSRRKEVREQIKKEVKKDE
jgi:phage terminase large subunit GpA-like protein